MASDAPAKTAPPPDRSFPALALDLRSLAVFRILIGGLLLVDLADRLRDVDVFYTDHGIWPRALALDALDAPWSFSLHLATGSTGGQLLLFSLGAVAALALLVGWRTRWAALACLILFDSLRSRNHLVSIGGDSVMTVALFWSCFLPVGARLSVDGLRDDAAERPTTVRSVASAALVVHLAAIYVFAGLHKWNPIWLSGRGFSAAVLIEQYAEPWARAVLRFPTLYESASYLTVFGELFGPLLLFVPRAPLRVIAIALGLGAHLAFGLFFKIGLFAPICMALWMAMLPAMVWERGGCFERWEARVRASAAWRLLHRHLPASAPVRLAPSQAGRLFAGVAISLVLAWNTVTTFPSLAPLEPWIEPFVRTLRLGQQWTMFARPSTRDGWFVIRGVLDDGSERDLFTGLPPRWEKPADVAASYGNGRWRRFLAWSTFPEHESLRELTARWFCDAWNERHPGAARARSVEVWFVHERTRLGDAAEDPPVPELFAARACAG